MKQSMERIYWQDHAGQNSNAWEDLSFVKDQCYLSDICTVGIILEENEISIVVAQSISKDNQVAGYIVIGKKLITKRELLQPRGKK